MAEITAALVKELREKTGAGMMDCKNALNETNGDIEAAVDWLRKKGLAKAAKKSGRVAADGLVGVAVEANLGVVVEVNSETDFVARNDDFQALVRGVLAVALDKAPRRRRRGGHGRALSRRRHGRATRSPTPSPPSARTSRCAAPPACMCMRASIGHYVHGADRRRPRPHRRDRRAGIEGRRGGAGRARPADRHACRGGEPAGARRRGPRPGDGRAREEGAGREERRQAAEGAGKDRRIRPQDLLQGSLPPRSGLRHRPRASRSRRR